MMLRWRGNSNHGAALPGDTPLTSLRYVIVDTELTSLDSRTNRLLSVGAIAMNGPRIMLGEQLYGLVNPGVEIPAQGVLIHKLRPADVANGAPLTEVLQQLRQFFQGAVLVGHFAEIDVKVLRKELGALGHQLTNPVICTARVHRWLVEHQQFTEDQFQQLENVDLASLAKTYGLGVYQAHHALDDAFITARLWQKLMHVLETRGITTLGRVLKFAKV